MNLFMVLISLDVMKELKIYLFLLENIEIDELVKIFTLFFKNYKFKYHIFIKEKFYGLKFNKHEKSDLKLYIFNILFLYLK